jgi:hypothetical protein
MRMAATRPKRRQVAALQRVDARGVQLLAQADMEVIRIIEWKVRTIWLQELVEEWR